MSTEPKVIRKSFTYETSLARMKGRSAMLNAHGRPPLHTASPVEFGGERGLWTPEDLFVATVDLCLMLTFVAIAEKRGVTVAFYESSAVGLLEWQARSYAFTRITVSPVVTLVDDASVEAARDVMIRAHDSCLIANSLSCTVIVDPRFEVMR